MYVHFYKIDGYDPEKQQQLCWIEFHVILMEKNVWTLCVSVRTKVPLMLQDTAGFGEPSTSQINIFCWPSSFISFRLLILGAPATEQNLSDTFGLKGKILIHSCIYNTIFNFKFLIFNWIEFFTYIELLLQFKVLFFSWRPFFLQHHVAPISIYTPNLLLPAVSQLYDGWEKRFPLNFCPQKGKVYYLKMFQVPKIHPYF